MKTSFTRKLCYKKFSHRLVMRVRDWSMKAQSRPKAPTPEIITWLLNSKFQTGDWKSMSTWVSEPRVTHLTLFFNDPKILSMLREFVADRHGASSA